MGIFSFFRWYRAGLHTIASRRGLLFVNSFVGMGYDGWETAGVRSTRGNANAFKIYHLIRYFPRIFRELSFNVLIIKYAESRE